MFAEAHPQAETFEPGSDNIPRTLIADVDGTKLDDLCFTTEAFTDVLAATRLPGATAREFLRNAIAFANDTLWGTLGANILIHPATIKELGSEFEDLIAELRYGCVAINSWTGVGFLLAQSGWGAFPVIRWKILEADAESCITLCYSINPKKAWSDSHFTRFHAIYGMEKFTAYLNHPGSSLTAPLTKLRRV